VTAWLFLPHSQFYPRISAGHFFFSFFFFPPLSTIADPDLTSCCHPQVKLMGKSPAGVCWQAFRSGHLSSQYNIFSIISNSKGWAGGRGRGVIL